LTCTVVPGYSDLVDSLQPKSAMAAPYNADHFILKMAARPWYPWALCDNTTTISTTGLGTRISRLSVVNTVPFTAYSHADLVFCLDSIPPAYKAKVFKFTSDIQPCYSYEVHTDTANCHPGSTYSNISLNAPHAGIDVSSNSEIQISSIGKSVFIYSSKPLRNTRVTIYNLLGQEIISRRIEDQKSSEIQVLAGSGYYIVKVFGDNVLKNAKVYLN
jgi:hypothetical protein